MSEIRGFSPRFVKPSDLGELSNFWHLARVSAGLDSHKRMVQAAEWFSKAYGYVTATGAYKDLSDMLRFR